MKIIITGAGGFVGARMVHYFTGQGHEVIGINRSRPAADMDIPAFEHIRADTTQKGGWQDELAGADVVINMAGRNIFGRWTEKTKQEILESRVQTTRNIVDAFVGKTAALLLSTSAVGFYGDRGDEPLDENEPPGDDFLASVCIQWEKEANRAAEKGVRVANMRFGLVMGINGGALKMMLPAFKAFVGGPLGKGTQFMPWIHIADLISAHDFVMSHAEIKGPVNCCAPNPARNEAFAKTLGAVLGRPAVFRVPKFALNLSMGELGGLMLASQRAKPAKLLEHGFSFAYPELRPALADLVA